MRTRAASASVLFAVIVCCVAVSASAQWSYYPGTSNINFMNGNVGIGAINPQQKLTVRDIDDPVLHLLGGPGNAYYGQLVVSTAAGAYSPYATPGDMVLRALTGNLILAGQHSSGSIMFTTGSSPNLERMIIDENGDVGIGTTNPSAKLDVSGTASVEVLEIRGGADLAEMFCSFGGESAMPKPGYVMSIDADNPGCLRVADSEYDRAVVGVVSGGGGLNSGLVLRQEEHEGGDGEIPIALTGRVYVLADASDGQIKPGDLLTTSATPGHVMRVEDFGEAQGAVIGKAMTSLDSGIGEILMVVSLQ
jgi:hypothetical protein